MFVVIRAGPGRMVPPVVAWWKEGARGRSSKESRISCDIVRDCVGRRRYVCREYVGREGWLDGGRGGRGGLGCAKVVREAGRAEFAVRNRLLAAQLGKNATSLS